MAKSDRMNPDKTKSSQMFDSLVLNAMEFLKRSVDELKDNPKYAVYRLLHRDRTLS